MTGMLRSERLLPFLRFYSAKVIFLLYSRIATSSRYFSHLRGVRPPLRFRAPSSRCTVIPIFSNARRKLVSSSMKTKMTMYLYFKYQYYLGASIFNKYLLPVTQFNPFVFYLLRALFNHTAFLYAFITFYSHFLFFFSVVAAE